MEIQERSAQYTQLLANSTAAKAILEPIPVPDSSNRPESEGRHRRQLPIEDSMCFCFFLRQRMMLTSFLDEDENMNSQTISNASPEQDVLSVELFSFNYMQGSELNRVKQKMLNNLNMSSQPQAKSSPRNLLDDVLGHASPPSVAKPATIDIFSSNQTTAGVQVYSKDAFTIEFKKANSDPHMTEITAIFKNGSSATISAFSLQVAVPKVFCFSHCQDRQVADRS